MDLLTASFDGGMYFLEGLGKGKFAEAQPVKDKAGARILISQYWDYEEKTWTQLETSQFPGEHAISCTTVDWDADGDFDLLLGTSSGKLFLRRNEGSARNISFATRNEQIDNENDGVDVPGGGAMIVVADWDLDGMWDIVSGSNSGEVYWFRNTGRIGKPQFSEAIKLVNASGKNSSPSDETIRPGTRVQVSVGDHNADGLPDLLVGDYSSQFVKGTEFTPEKRTRYDALRKELRTLTGSLSELSEKNTQNEGTTSDSDRAKLEERRQELEKELSALRPKTSRHGWVWLFERKS